MEARRRLQVNLKRLLEGRLQEEVAALTVRFDEDGRGLTQQDISDYKKCRRIPKLDTLEWLAGALDVDITDLLADPDAHPEEPDVRVRVLQRKVSELAVQNQALFANLEGLVNTLVKSIQP